MSEEGNIRVTKIELTLYSKVSKSGKKFLFNIPPNDILNERFEHGVWYKLFALKLTDEEVKNLGLEK